MEITYRVLGADGKEYGPVSHPQLQSWITEGRLRPDTQISRSDDGPWRQASQFGELAWQAAAAPALAPAPAPTAVTPAPDNEVAAALTRQMRSGAGWFYWIAGLSLVNTISAFSGSDWGFVIGLSVTQVIDRGVGVLGLSLVLDALILGLFVGFGIFSNKGHRWAFIAGIVLYTLDSLVSLIGPDLIGLAFHGLALWGLFSGLKAAHALSRLPRAA